MASLQDSAINYLVKTRGGTWKVDFIDVVTVENQDQHAFMSDASCPLVKVAKKGASGSGGDMELMPQVGWQVLHATSSTQDQAVIWLDTTNQMIWDVNECVGEGVVSAYKTTPWWVLALLGVGAMLLLWPKKKG